MPPRPAQPLRAAIYARYSTDEQRPESIVDQIESCRRYCERMGWPVTATYFDAAASGASVKLRPEFEQLRLDAENHRFDVVVTESLDRLSRRLADMADLHDRLSYHGIRLHTVDRGEISALLMGMLGGMAQSFLEDLRHKTKRGQRGKVLAGKAAGGLGYGYRVNPTDKGLRTIDLEEARTVRRIFAEYADGVSPRTIAARLNTEKCPGPGGREWGDTTIRGQVARGTGVLNNMAYVGKIAWDRCSYVKDPTTGKRQARPKSPDEWEVVEAPELRIIDDETWARVKARQGDVRLEMSRDEDGNALNRAHRQRHLLSGLLFCGCCGSPFVIVNRFEYGCNKSRSKATCANKLRVRRDELERRVMVAFEEKMGVDHDARSLRRISEALAGEEGRSQSEVVEAQAELREVEGRLTNIMRAIEDGLYSNDLKARVERLEKRRAELHAKITDLRIAPAGSKLESLISRGNIGDLADYFTECIQRKGDLLPDDAVSAGHTTQWDWIRASIDKIVLTPDGEGKLIAELYGDAAAWIDSKGLAYLFNDEAPVSGETGASLSVVAGAGFEPATFRL